MTTEEYQQQHFSHGNASAGALPEPPEEIRGNAKEVFISYSTKNPNEAAFVCEWLEFNGMRCWVAPRDLISGTNFADNIEFALGNAKMLVLILSKDSANSPWVEGEINTAFSARKPILVFQIDDVEPAGSFRVMLAKFPRIRACGNEETDGFALVEMAQKLLGGEQIIVNPRERNSAGTPKKSKKNQSKSKGKKCLILSTQQDLALANVLKKVANSLGGIPEIIAVDALFWLSENEVPKSFRQRVADARLVVVILSPGLEDLGSARALIKLAFSTKKAILPYKIYPGKPSAGMSLMLGMAHWLDVSNLPTQEEGILEFRKAISTHLGAGTPWLKILSKAFSGIVEIVLVAAVLIFVLAAVIFVANNLKTSEAEPQVVEKVVEKIVEKDVPAETVPAESVPAKREFAEEIVGETPPEIRKNIRLAKISQKIRNSQTTNLKKAFEENDLVAAETALANGANPDEFLVPAARRGNAEFVDLLLCYGAKAFLPQNDRFDAFTAAVVSKNADRIKIVETLCDYGFPVNGKNAWGAQFLADCIHHNCPEAMQILLEFGANPDAKNENKSAREMARERNRGDFLKLLDEIQKSKSSTYGNDKMYVNFEAATTVAEVQEESKSVPAKNEEKSISEAKFLEKKKFGDFEIIFISVVLSNTDGEPQKFGIGKTEVTQAQWEKIMKKNPSKFRGKNLPVEAVSWDEAIEFCEKLTARERKMKRLPKGYKYSLPTSEQWEIACRAGTETRFCSGNTGNDLKRVAWYIENSGNKPHPVAKKAPNAWGIYDMHGNVWEWCLDISPNHFSTRVIRGGCWNNYADNCESSNAYKEYSSSRLDNLGFRVALVPEE